jgi:hypothetical protein
MLAEDPVYCSLARACHSAARLNAGLAPEETVEIPSHVTRGQFGADIEWRAKEHPKKGLLLRKTPRDAPKSSRPPGWHTRAFQQSLSLPQSALATSKDLFLAA